MRGLFYLSFVVYLLSIQTQAQNCVGQPSYGTQQDYFTIAQDNEIKVMSYNVENLFDTKHDDGRDDFEFLPIGHPAKKNCDFKQGFRKNMCKNLDWTDEKLGTKLNQIRNVVAYQGDLPDILAVQEVENGDVLSYLTGYLGYEYYVHTTGNDSRIELGLLFNEKKIFFREAQELIIEFPQGVGVKKTRNILLVHFSPRSNPDKVLAMYVNHWPSQASPAGARVQAAITKRMAIDYYTALYGAQNYHVISVGDFNTIDKDNPHPFQTVLYDMGWENVMMNLDYLYYTEGYKQDPLQMHLKMPQGTYFYGKERVWNKLDQVFLSTNFYDKTSIEVVPESYRIMAADFMLTTFKDKSGFCSFGTPMRYDHFKSSPEEAGYSDHFPVLFKIKIQ